MRPSPRQVLTTPRRDDLGLIRIENQAGLRISVLPSGSIFAIEHEWQSRVTMINQVLGSPVANGMSGIFLRLTGPDPKAHSIVGGGSTTRIGAGPDRMIWEGGAAPVGWRLTLWLHPEALLWLWRLRVQNHGDASLDCDATLLQDLGLGDPGYLMNNEAYASHYLDHHIETHPRMGAVIATRQNLSQGDAHPWVAHGCLEGSSGFATDFRQFVGPGGRDLDLSDRLFASDLPSSVLQYETGCAAIRSPRETLAPGAEASWTFFGLYQPDHTAASSAADIVSLSAVEQAARHWVERDIEAHDPAATVLHTARSAGGKSLDQGEIGNRYPRRTLEEKMDCRLSFFTPGRTHKRHVVLGAKDRLVARRHGSLLRSGPSMLPDHETLGVTCWMHGVFAAQLTIGNTSFHKLFSVSRDPYNVTRHSGLRILFETAGEWRLLATPSVFEMGLGDCRWIYKFEDRTISVHAVVAGEEPAISWRIVVEGKPCRFLVFGQIVLGDQDYANRGTVEIDARRKRISFGPDPSDRWGKQYPQAVYHLVTSAPRSVEQIGGDELLYADQARRSGGYVAIRTRPTRAFAFAVIGSLTNPERASALADKYATSIDEPSMLAASERYWRNVTRGVRVTSGRRSRDVESLDTILPWFVHDAIVHLTVPHGLEQYTGAAWGTRDVCQGPVELLLSLNHDETAKEILRILFAQQYETEGGWPQWFMLEPYSDVQGKEAHGDVIVWPLKALCDYIEATGDFPILDEKTAWRREDDFQKTERHDSIALHVEKLVGTIRQRFLPGTHLIRYGAGDWNNSLQPVDPERRDWMVSSWTVALLYEQLRRYGEILRLSGDARGAKPFASLAASMRKDFNTYLIRDGVLAGYAVFQPRTNSPELLLHPDDRVTGVSFSLIAMTQAIIGGLFTAAQARRHYQLIKTHLLFPDGARLMERPIHYHGGVESLFRRAKSSAFFGREVGLMYVHSHLRFAEAAAVLRDAGALWDALQIANPISVTDRLPHAALRQRNTYFSSSDAAFPDRYAAEAQWSRVRDRTIDVEGGWRTYSSGPGLYLNMVVQRLFGFRGHFGQPHDERCAPKSTVDLQLVRPGKPGRTPSSGRNPRSPRHLP